MNSLHRIFIAGCFTLILLLVCVLSPRPGIALKPLDDEAILRCSPSNQIASVNHNQNLKPLEDRDLDGFSPSTTEKPAATLSPDEYSAMLKAEFDSAVCFKKCHYKDD
ncbi:MAG: hypothetical protein Q7U02_03380, partial [Desulfosalsimonadaceae bacterium]|nr:hypothetical protein [Desulfosalsimonadaceae bacterium]